nr:MAG TPA: hypothetical protein [Caudoviricetes sp.]
MYNDYRKRRFTAYIPNVSVKGGDSLPTPQSETKLGVS